MTESTSGPASHYEVLGIPESATEADVRHAYRRLAKAAHPDAAGDPTRFRLITDAYDVLSDPARRAAYDRRLHPATVAAPPPRPRRRYARYVVLLAAGLVVASIVWLVAATMRQSVGDECLVGTWRGEAFEVPFRGVLDGREITTTIRGGAGVVLTVAGDGFARSDYATAEPLVGRDGPDRVEGVYTGTAAERWRAEDGSVTLSHTDSSGLRFEATINGRTPDQRSAVTVLDGEYPYACTTTALALGPYRYTRASWLTAPSAGSEVSTAGASTTAMKAAAARPTSTRASW